MLYATLITESAIKMPLRKGHVVETKEKERLAYAGAKRWST